MPFFPDVLAAGNALDSMPSSGDDDFHCLVKAQLEGGIMAEIPYQVELTSAFVDEHI